MTDQTTPAALAAHQESFDAATDVALRSAAELESARRAAADARDRLARAVLHNHHIVARAARQSVGLDRAVLEHVLDLSTAAGDASREYDRTYHAWEELL